jgi:hypothetical protein
MTTTHTPGPWEAYSFRASEDTRGAMVRVMRPETEGTRANPDICRVYAMGDDGRPGGEMEANARLIAAAPETAAERDRLRHVNADLLAALRELSEWMRSHTGPRDGTHDMLCRACAALAKAEGGR